MKYIDISHIEAHSIPGANVGNCIQEAIELAAKEWHNVILHHNGKVYPIYVNDIFAVIVEAEERRRKNQHDKD